MRLRALLPAALLAAVAAAAGGAPEALAQPSQAQIEAAKKAAAEAADRALEAYEAGKYDDAVAGFRAADKAFHAPKFLLYVARAQVKMGQLAAAKGTYEGILQEKLPVFAPQEFFSAQADARKELAELAPRVPTLTVQARGGLQSASLDGKAVPLDQPVAVDPGKHTLTGSGAGVPDATLEVSLAEGDKKEAVLEPPAAPPAPTATGTGTPPDRPPTGIFARMPLPTYVAYGAGAVGLVLGGVFSGLTLAKKGEYDDLRKADPLDAARVNDAAGQGRAFAAVADVGFLVALAGAATGTVWWIVAPKPEEASKDGLNTGPRVFLAPQVGGVAAFGTF